ncbi:condensation domain-containing protein [Dactylosporangium sp. CS-033363]|uniref:condensation domain-containing protein n=1 Tax=Dactylosporangium sp. CS-033363 TaxID=3239935 RepID=UPI003D8E6B26
MERITVTFEGAGAGTGNLTWGQQQVFQAMRELNTSMSMGGVVPVHDGRGVDDFVEELRFFMTRYPAMRTLLRYHPDGTYSQETFAAGTAYLEVHTAPSSSGTVRSSTRTSSLVPAAASAVAVSPAAESLANEVFAGWKSRIFDYTNEWPIRMAVIRSGLDGPVTHVLVEVTHVATDVTGLATMIRELSSRSTIGSSPATGPLEIAAQQEAATRQTDHAMRYWDTQLRLIDPQRFPAGFHAPDGPRFRQVVWTSPALHLASERLAALLSIDTAPVLLAAYAVAFTRVVGGAPFASQVIVGNRFRPGLATVVSPFAQNGLVVIDPRTITSAETVLRARQTSMSASKYAYYDPSTRQSLIDNIGKDRGEPIDLQVLYNERRLALRPPQTTPPESEILAAAQSASNPVRETELPYFNEKLMVNIDDVPDTIQITTELDTAYLAVADLLRLLQEMENFTVAAALDPTTPALP